MQQITFKHIRNIKDMAVRRNADGLLTHVSLHPNGSILRAKYIALKFFSEDAKEYIFSKHKKQLSSLEKELL